MTQTTLEYVLNSIYVVGGARCSPAGACKRHNGSMCRFAMCARLCPGSSAACRNADNHKPAPARTQLRIISGDAA
jgi:hypothetical protein